MHINELYLLLSGASGIRLLYGLYATLEISLISIALSMVFGLGAGLFMTIRHKACRFMSRLYLETVRIMPQLVLLFIAYFGLTRMAGVHISGFAASILVFTFWGAAEMGDLVRGALESIPRHQYESAYVLGFSNFQTFRYIILPQALRRLTPPLINLFTRMIKTTSLVVMIGVTDVLKTGQQIIEANRYQAPNGALWMYGIIFILYFLACFPLSFLAGKLEARWR